MKIVITTFLLMPPMGMFLLLQNASRPASTPSFALSQDHSPSIQNQQFFSGVQEAWVNRYASGIMNDDAATDIAVEPTSGDVYVTGYTRNLRVGNDYFTVKYDATGAKIWTAEYNGSGDGDDIAVAMALDVHGNVYVTGKSWSGNTYDYVTIKYNAAGVEQWTARYDGSNNSNDEASDLAVDVLGNVYVTGTSDGDYATVKYNRDGVEQWVALYNGTGNLEDEARAIAVNDAGEVYVTGSSRGAENLNLYDYATLKYDSSGVEQWVARYNGSGNDHAHALALDNEGNVYVTGGNFATVKYNSNGIQQWVARTGSLFSYATALAIDALGNIFVTGWTQLDNRRYYFTIKYRNTGAEEWKDVAYDVLGEPQDIVVDAQGSAYVTGNSWGSYATIKYNHTGEQQWVVRYDNGPEYFYSAASALGIDATGNVYVTGSSQDEATSSDYATVKYNPAGQEQWIMRYSGVGNSDDRALNLAIDDSGNVYATGKTFYIGPAFYTTVKYNSAGLQRWTARHPAGSPYSLIEETKLLTVDRSGNVYMTGNIVTDAHYSFTDYRTVKYNPAGIQQWSFTFGGSYDEDYATAITGDEMGNVYVTGASFSFGPSHDYATLKYNSNGEIQWIAKYNGVENNWDVATDITVDKSVNDGNVYVTGWTGGWQEIKRDYGTVKYNSSGVQQWVARYNGPGNSRDEATAIASDSAGNVYVTGASVGAGTSLDYATVKYNSSGIQEWVARYNGPGNSDDRVYSLAVDHSGNVYVTGMSDGANTSSDYATIKYNSAGEEQWVVRFNGDGNSEDQATALAIDAWENVYVTGWSLGPGTGFNYVTIKYNSSSVEQWNARYNSPENAEDKAEALAIDNAGNVYVTGSSRGKGWSVYTTIKYVQNPVSVEERNTTQQTTYWLAQNYPNPFNPSTKIRYAISKPGHVMLKVFNLTGQEVATLVNETKPVGEYQIEWNANNLPSGVYLYRLEAGEFVATKKLLLLK